MNTKELITQMLDFLSSFEGSFSAIADGYEKTQDVHGLLNAIYNLSNYVDDKYAEFDIAANMVRKI